MTLELNCFFLKYLLWHPPSHPITIARLIFTGFWCIVATREYYQYITVPSCNKFGTNAWLTVCQMVAEVLVIIKNSPGQVCCVVVSIVLAFFFMPSSHALFSSNDNTSIRT